MGLDELGDRKLGHSPKRRRVRFHHPNSNIHACSVCGKTESRGYHLDVMSTEMSEATLHLVTSLLTPAIFGSKTPIAAMLLRAWISMSATCGMAERI